ncbi:RHS repeat-associated core domain-containing protein [Spirobacillus cienkowskii]|uniref:RHS repeat-associated core domain-containing protein n=1 Tax=Spirobacillus cienkowskii TaxID=495820 RepID=UPI0030D2B418
MGKGFRGSVSENQDKLFFTANNYVYSSTEKKLAADQKMLETERTYNHYHLLLSEKTKLNGNLIFLKEYDYPEWQSKNFDSLDENYNLPVQIKATYFNRNNLRTEVSKFAYDNFGNLVRQELPNGIVKEYSYLSQDETFNKMTHLLKQEKQYSINDNKVKIIENKYINIKNYNNNYIQLLEEKIYVVSSINCANDDKNCDFLYRKENFIYNLDFNKNNFFTLPNKVVVSGNSLNGVNKYYAKLITYENNESYSSITTDYYSGDNILLAMEFNYYNPFTGNLVKEKSKEGIEKQFEYDLFGRVTKEYLIDEKEQKHLFKNYTYNINNEDVLEGYGTSSKRVQSLDGNIEFTVYDSLGRVISIYQKNHEENKFYLLKSYLYGVTGQKIEEKNYNIDAKNNLYFTVNYFQYDYLGREILKKQPSGIQSLTLYDDVEQTTTYQVKSSDKTIKYEKVIYNNNLKLPVREEYYNTKDNLVHQKNWIYDGFGNKIKFIDSNGSETFYEYNNLLQLVKISNAKLVSFFYSYDPLYLEKPVSISVMQNGKNKKLLAYQVFNELGQKIVDGDSFGKENRYTYDIKGNLITKLLKSGIKTDYYYDGLNNLIKAESMNHNIKDVSYYDYDPATLLLQSETNSIGKLKYNYDKNGNLLSVIYPDNRSISYLYDFYGKIISIKDIKDIETIYNYNYQTGLLESVQFLIPGQEDLKEVYFYDNLARLSLKIMPNKNMVRYDYNNMGQLSNMSYLASNNDLILGYSLAYHNNGNILSRERIEGGSSIIVSRENYHYDALNNLSEYRCEVNYCPKNSNGKSIVIQNFEFDDLNNINKIKTTSLDHEIDVIRYNYSEINPAQVVSIIHNDKEKIFEYNDDGQMIKDDQENQFFYNSSQKIEKIRFSNGNEITYNYLANGSLYFNRNHDNSYSYLYYHGNKVLNQLDSEKVTSYFLGTKNIIGHIDHAESGLNPLFYLTDQASSVIKVIDNKNENIHNFIYTLYGEATDLSTTQVSYNNKFSYGFNGELFDKTSGFQILGNGYRAYSPRLQRFIQYDEHSPFGKGGINGYIYANNNPIMFYDPTGEYAESILACSVLGAAIMGIGGTIYAAGSFFKWSMAVMKATSHLKLGWVGIGGLTGLSAGATGIASSVYGYKSTKASEAGDKNAADYYTKMSHDYLWSSFALGVFSAGTFFSLSEKARLLAERSSLLSERVRQQLLRVHNNSFVDSHTRAARNVSVGRSVSDVVRRTAEQTLTISARQRPISLSIASSMSSVSDDLSFHTPRGIASSMSSVSDMSYVPDGIISFLGWTWY